MKKIIGLLICAAIAASAMPVFADGADDAQTTEGTQTTEIEEKVLFGSEIFLDPVYSVYDEENGPGKISKVFDNRGFEASMDSGWNKEYNGVKIDLTEKVKGNSGKVFVVSADIVSWAWTYENSDGTTGVNKAKLFFKVVPESSDAVITEIAEGPDTAVSGQASTLSGSAELSFEDTDKVYLCMTQGGGTLHFNNLSVGLMNEEKLFGNEIFAEGNFTIYDDTNEAGSIERLGDYGIQANMGNSWDNNNGVKTDITEYVKDYSGSVFSLSANITNWAFTYADRTGVNKAQAFFEVVGSEDTTVIPIVEGPDTVNELTHDDTYNSDTATLSGSANLSFGEGDTVYLCFKQGGGQHQYKNISFSVQTPAADKLVGSEIFQKSFEAYDDENTDAKITQIWNNYGFEMTMGNNWDVNNGVKRDVTDYVRDYSGKKFSVSVDVTSYAWNGTDNEGNPIINKASAFFLVKGEDGNETTVALGDGPAAADEITDNTATLTGSSVLTFGEKDTVYLCFKQGGGVQQYKKIELSVSEPDPGEDPEPEKAVKVNAPVLSEGKAAVTASNTTDENAEIVIYAAQYDGERLSSVSINTITVPAGTDSETYEFSASAGDVVYVWSGGQEPYTAKTSL